MSINPNVRELLKYSYDSERSVARPREVADSFARAIYVPTLLDAHLLPVILSDELDLVLLTGNPGDGKSAFLAHLISGGYHETTGLRRIRVLHDATEPSDTDDPSASAVRDLERFLAPVEEALRRNSRPDEVHVVGINKGLLVRTFLSRETRFGALGPAIERALEDGEASSGSVRVRVVDLNRRAEVTLENGETPSLFDRLLERITSPSLWEEAGCGTCEAADWCPFLFNASTLRSQPAADRMRLLWLVQQLEGERHATLRDLLAALAYIIAGHADMYREGDSAAKPVLNPCDFVAREKALRDFAALFRRLLFSSTFVDDDVFEGAIDQVCDQSASSALTYGMAPDVIREHIALLDPAEASSSPHWDSVENRVVKSPEKYLQRLSAHRGPGSGLLSAFADAARARLEQFDGILDEAQPQSPEYSDALEGRDWIIYLLVRFARRYHYFVEHCEHPESLTPYRSLETYIATLRYCAHARQACVAQYETVLYEIIPRAVSRAERLAGQDPSHRLRVRWKWPPVSVAAVQLVEAGGSSLQAGPPQDPFVEHSAQWFEYVPAEDASFRLRLDLRSFEGVFRIAAGYSDGFAGVPRTNQFRNFREALRSSRSSEMYIFSEERPEDSVSVTVTQMMRFE